MYLTADTSAIRYNHLNLPVNINVSGSQASRNIIYVCNPTDVKFCEVVVDSANGTTEYTGNYIYENGSLKQISQPEGYIEPDGNGWQYVYRYSDIWGNTRLTYADDNNNGTIETGSQYSEIRREQNYYPFGLEHKGYNGVSYGVKNNLKTYQGQEFTEDLGLNTHEWKYRMSDPAIGRFWQIDPLAEDYSYQSPYNFSENDPVSGVELEGLEKLHVTVYNVLKNNTGGYTKSAPQMTSVTDNHNWKETRYESQYNVYGNDGQSVTQIHTGKDANQKLARAGINITESERVGLSMGQVATAAGNNREFQKAGETAKNYVAGVGIALGAGAIVAGEASALTYLGLASDANVVLGGEEGSLTSTLGNEEQRYVTLGNTAATIGGKAEAINTITSAAAKSDSKFSAAINLVKAVFDLSTMVFEKRKENNDNNEQQ